jgi:hypothetical protein
MIVVWQYQHSEQSVLHGFDDIISIHICLLGSNSLLMKSCSLLPHQCREFKVGLRPKQVWKWGNIQMHRYSWELRRFCLKNQSLEHDPTKQSLEHDPTKQSLEHDPTKQSLEHDPTKQSLEHDPIIGGGGYVQEWGFPTKWGFWEAGMDKVPGAGYRSDLDMLYVGPNCYHGVNWMHAEKSGSAICRQP